MWKAKSLVALSFLSIVMSTSPAMARSYVEIDNAPPASRVEVVPAARHGFVWAPGYWMWDYRSHRHVWMRGHWIAARPGQRWVSERWERHGARYQFQPGHWQR